MEIQIRQEQGKIYCNFEDAKEFLDKQLEIYRKLVFTEDTKKDAKQTVADLRKMKKEFEDRCKEVKNQFVVPLNEFLEKAHELSAMFDEPIVFINTQVEAFEEARKQEKANHIATLYDEIMGEDEEIATIIPLKRIYNKKWENSTTTDKAIKEEIMTKKVEVKTNLGIIRGFDTDCIEQALQKYTDTLDVQASIQFIQQWEAQKKVIIKNEKESIKQEAKQEAMTEAIEAFIPADTGDETEGVTYTIFLTKDSKAKLEAFMDSVGIEYWEVK